MHKAIPECSERSERVNALPDPSQLPTLVIRALIVHVKAQIRSQGSVSDDDGNPVFSRSCEVAGVAHVRAR